MTAEAHVPLPWHRELFSDTQLETAERRLREHRFDIDTFLTRAGRNWPAWARQEQEEDTADDRR